MKIKILALSRPFLIDEIFHKNLLHFCTTASSEIPNLTLRRPSLLEVKALVPKDMARTVK